MDATVSVRIEYRMAVMAIAAPVSAAPTAVTTNVDVSLLLLLLLVVLPLDMFLLVFVLGAGMMILMIYMILYDMPSVYHVVCVYTHMDIFVCWISRSTKGHHMWYVIRRQKNETVPV